MATYRIDVRIDPTQARAGARVVRGQLDSVRRSADRVGRVMRQAFAFVGVGAALTAGIRVIASFEQSLSTLRAITGATGAEFAALREEAYRLGITTRFSATQAADAMVYLARAGFDAREVYEATAGVLTLAQAGALDLARAADLASNVLQGFNLRTAETARVVDVLALAANSSNTNVEQLAQAMSYVAPASASLGVTIEDTAAAVSALSDAGIQSTRAGTGLRQIFIQLEEAGGDLSVAANGMLPVLEELRSRNIGLSEATELVGVRQATALLVLLNSIDKIRELGDAYRDAEGSAARIAAIMDDNLNGALLAARSALEGLIISLGDAGATSTLTAVFAGIAEALRFMARNVDRVVDVLEGLSVVLIINLARQAIPAAIAGFRALGVAIVTNPLGALATVITVAVAAFVALADQISLTGEGAGSAFDFIIVLFGDMVNLIGRGINFVIGLFSGWGDSLEEFNFGDFVLGIARALDQLVAVFSATFATIIEYWRTFPMVWADIIIQGINFALRSVEGFINSIIRALNRIPGVSIDTLDGVMPQIENIFAGSAANLGTTFADAYRASIEQANIETYVQGAIDRANARGEARAARNAAQENPFTTPDGTEDTEVDEARAVQNALNQLALDRQALIDREIANLQREAEAIMAVGDEREVLSARLAIEDQLRSQLREANSDLTEQELNDLARLTDAEATAIEVEVRRNLELQRQADIIQELRGEQAQLEAQLGSLNALRQQELITLEEYNRQLREIGVRQLELRVQNGQASFADTFLLELERMSNGVQSFVASAGEAFGSYFSAMSSGFARSIGQAIVYSEDLGASLQNVARQALASLISSLVELGIQFIINNAIGQSLAAAATAASVAQASIVASAWAPAAAFASLATSGTNALPAAAALGSTVALAETLAAAGAGLANGGLVYGPGSGSGDRVLRALSAGEFVVNADATANNLALLRQINSGQAPTAPAPIGGSTGSQGPIIQSGGSSMTVHAPTYVTVQSTGDEKKDQALAADLERRLGKNLDQRIIKVVRDEQRNRGALKGKPGAIKA